MSQNRHYISPGNTTGAFLKSLQANGLRHAVLRWFEHLPHVEPGEDIDILVADEDATTLRAMLRKHGPGQAVDLYSASGRHELGWRGASYLPPRMAKQLLANRIHGKACDHPGPDEHWASLAFHVVYHKGTLNSRDHDYRQALGLAEETTLQELSRELRKIGWQPSLKALWRWRRHNHFISGHFPDWFPKRLRGA